MVGLPSSSALTVKGLSVGSLSEQPVSIANTHPARRNRIGRDRSLTMVEQFPNSGARAVSTARPCCTLLPRPNSGISVLLPYDADIIVLPRAGAALLHESKRLTGKRGSADTARTTALASTPSAGIRCRRAHSRTRLELA